MSCGEPHMHDVIKFCMVLVMPLHFLQLKPEPPKCFISIVTMRITKQGMYNYAYSNSSNTVVHSQSKGNDRQKINFNQSSDSFVDAAKGCTLDNAW